jgi:hypothetical protein
VSLMEVEMEKVQGCSTRKPARSTLKPSGSPRSSGRRWDKTAGRIDELTEKAPGRRHQAHSRDGP